MKLLKSIINFFSNPVADLSGSYRERKRIAAETASVIAKAEHALKLAKIEAKIAKQKQQETTDTDYDMEILRGRNETLMDNYLIIFFTLIFLAHFIKPLQPFMSAGWKAMGYDGAPWYFEFIIVGIAISTLGLMRIFRVFWPMNVGKPRDKPKPVG